MKSEKYTKKNGEEGTSFKFQDGDVVTPVYDKPFKRNAEGEVLYDSFLIKVKNDESEVIVTLTKTQYEQLMKHEPLTNKTIKAENYENKYGTFVGLRVE